jgi:hypothetical protein
MSTLTQMSENPVQLWCYELTKWLQIATLVPNWDACTGENGIGPTLAHYGNQQGSTLSTTAS